MSDPRVVAAAEQWLAKRGPDLLADDSGTAMEDFLAVVLPEAPTFFPSQGWLDRAIGAFRDACAGADLATDTGLGRCVAAAIFEVMRPGGTPKDEMTANSGLGGPQEARTGAGGSEGRGHDLSAIATACGEFLAVWCDQDAESPAFGRPVGMLLDALVSPDQPTGEPETGAGEQR